MTGTMSCKECDNQLGYIKYQTICEKCQDGKYGDYSS